MKRFQYLFCSILLSFVILFPACHDQKKLPILGNREARVINNKDGSTTVDTVYQSIPPFSFLNQDSVPVTDETFRNKIYVADFFFTSCTSICPTMHRNMKTVFEEYKDNPDVMFLSHTIDFKYDKPSVLKKYAVKLGVDGPKWQFAYGSKDSVYKIATKDYLVAVMEDSTAEENYVHQGWLVLIDKQKHLRGTYDGTNPKEVAQLKKDIRVLLDEDKK